MHPEFLKATRGVEGLKRRLWKSKDKLQLTDSSPLVQFLDPFAAAKFLGLEVILSPEIDFLGCDQDLAGILCRNERKVYVATKYGPAMARFTLAYEIGHFLCHKDRAQFRDMPFGSKKQKLDVSEAAMNYFATLFLMPEKLVVPEFRNEYTAFQLDITPEQASKGSTQMKSELLCRCEHFANVHLCQCINSSEYLRLQWLVAYKSWNCLYDQVFLGIRSSRSRTTRISSNFAVMSPFGNLI